MSEQRNDYKTCLHNPVQSCDTIAPEKRALSTRNLDELEHHLAQLERKLVPLLNQVRAMRGKKPVIVPEG